LSRVAPWELCAWWFLACLLPMPPVGDFQSVREAAAYRSVHEETIRRWAREGVISAAKLGNRGGFRFKREDLDRFLEGRLQSER
jgi:excisionase family DNA binding protein